MLPPTLLPTVGPVVRYWLLSSATLKVLLQQSVVTECIMKQTYPWC